MNIHVAKKETRQLVKKKKKEKRNKNVLAKVISYALHGPLSTCVSSCPTHLVQLSAIAL